MQNTYLNRFPLDRNWVLHRGPELSSRDRIHATIGPKRRILLNANLFRLMGSPEAVRLYYNSKISKIAIEAVEPGTPEVFPVIYRRGSYEIPAAAFCRTNKIRIRATHKFQSPIITPDQRLFLDLKHTMIITRRPKRTE